MRTDPNEWKNLAKNTKYSRVIKEHQAFLPKVNRKPAPGSAHRILTRDKNGKVIWQGDEIRPDDPIPGIED